MVTPICVSAGQRAALYSLYTLYRGVTLGVAPRPVEAPADPSTPAGWPADPGRSIGSAWSTSSTPGTSASSAVPGTAGIPQTIPACYRGISGHHSGGIAERIPCPFTAVSGSLGRVILAVYQRHFGGNSEV